MYAWTPTASPTFLKVRGDSRKNLLSVPPADIGIPAVVLYEILFGLGRVSQSAKRRGQLDTMLTAVTILPFDQNAAAAAANVRVALEKRGTPIGPLDILIAGTAIAAGCILVTHNTGEFARVPGLRIEDWL
jgi:tRNA(fMet)-specific endonuclease VapC